MHYLLAKFPGRSPTQKLKQGLYYVQPVFAVHVHMHRLFQKCNTEYKLQFTSMLLFAKDTCQLQFLHFK